MPPVPPPSLLTPPNVEAVEVPVAAIGSGTALNVKLPDVEAEFDSDASKQILANAGSDEGTKLEIRLEEKNKTELSDDQKAAADTYNESNNPKFLNFDILAKKADGKENSVFTSGNTAGSVRLKVKYPHSATDTVKCYWLKDNGSQEEVTIESFDPVAGTVTLRLSHFSVYVLATIPPTPPAPPSGSSSSGGSSGGGGGSSGSTATHPIQAEVSKDPDGTVSLSKTNAAKGDKVTISVKPDRYYTVDGVIVRDSKGKQLAVKDNGDSTFTFDMPADKVTVESTFSWVNPFADVANSAYYVDAVEWMLKREVTQGTTETTFSPNLNCTRAQIVTFLWRAAGSPAPKGTVSFADVSAGSYYAKAVAWAIENGITDGIGGGLFGSANDCTRAQIAAFLFRAYSK